jgi:hypothetical protein
MGDNTLVTRVPGTRVDADLLTRVPASQNRIQYVTFDLSTASVFDNNWLGVSIIQCQINYVAPRHFTIVGVEQPQLYRFCLCVRWVQDGVVHRYKLWEDVGEVLEFPLYNNEVIPPYFTLELWDNNNPIVLSDPLTITTSLIERPENMQGDVAQSINIVGTQCSSLSLPLPLDLPAIFGDCSAGVNNT